MKYFFLPLILTFLLIQDTYCQQFDHKKIYLWPAEAYKSYTKKDFSRAASIYTSFLNECKNKGIVNQDIIDNTYNLACCLSLAMKPDSAFIVLNEVSENDLFISQYPHILTDGDLKSLHSDERWPLVIKKIEAHKALFEKNIDKNLQSSLDTIYDNDQKFRRSSAKMNKDFGRDSKEAKEEWKKVLYNDSLNLIKIKDFIKKNGWVGPRKAGFRSSLAIYLVIQHADLKTQQKYYPIMKKAVSKGDARPQDLAFMEDRILLRRGKEQIYGSQLRTIKEKDGKTYPIRLSDPEHVDERRFRVGLESMSEYLSPDKWDPIEYLKVYKDLKY